MMPSPSSSAEVDGRFAPNARQVVKPVLTQQIEAAE